MNLNSIEAAILNDAAAELEANKSAIDSFVGPVEVSIVNGALHVAEDAFAKLPFGLAGLIDQALSSYATQVEADLPQYTNAGIDGVAAYLKAIAAKLAG